MHTIRLRGPWEYRPASQPTAALQRLKLPADWASVASEEPEAFEFYRSFQMPTGIEAEDEIYLVLQQLPSAELELNGQPLGSTTTDAAARFSIKQHLAQRNQLKITLSLTANQPCNGEVAIQIE